MKYRKRGTGTVQNGYLVITRNHVRTSEHVRIAEKALGRPIPKGAQVHHANGNKLDNRNENLVICPNEAYHKLLHQRMRAVEACGNANWRRCVHCQKYDDPSLMYSRRKNAWHRECRNTYLKEKKHGNAI